MAARAAFWNQEGEGVKPLMTWRKRLGVWERMAAAVDRASWERQVWAVTLG